MVYGELSSGLIKAVAGLNCGLPIQYEAVKFANAKTAFITMHQLPNETEMWTLGTVGCDRHSGILQLDINYPNNKGVDVIMAVVDQMNQYFYNGRVFAQTNINIRIDVMSIGPKLSIDGWIKQPVSIKYYAYADRITN